MSAAAVWLVDAAIVITLAELAVLFVLWRRRGTRALAPRDFAANVGAGLCLMLGLRAALGGASWLWVAAALTLAGALHGFDLMRRIGRA